MLKKNQIMVLVGETGSGKTTQVSTVRNTEIFNFWLYLAYDA